MDIKKYIIEYLQREYKIDDSVDIGKLNYLSSGYVNSIDLIKFFSELEEKFNFEFSEDDYNNPKIFIVEELVRLINDKIKT